MSKTGCDKNCSTCDINNRSFCAVQLGLKSQELIVQQQEMINSLVQILSPLLSGGAAPISPNLGGETERVSEIHQSPNFNKV